LFALHLCAKALRNNNLLPERQPTPSVTTTTREKLTKLTAQP